MSEIENICKDMGRFFLGYLCAIAILGTFTPGYLFEPLALRPIECKFDLLFHSFLYGITIFSLWQLGFYISELVLLIYRRFKPKEDET